MKFLFFGTGSIGKRHIKNIQSVLGSSATIIVCRHAKDDQKTQELKELGIESFYDIDEAFNQNPDAVFITNPTSLHMDLALKAAERGIHIFMEKPISHKMDHIERLKSLIDEKRLTFFVGYDMRYHPVLKEIKKMLDENKIGKILSVDAEFGSYLPDWRKGDYSKMYSASKSLGGGVTLDISHEIDYLIWLFGDVKNVSAIVEKRSDLDIDCEDNSDMILRFQNKLVGTIHLDYNQKHTSRKFKAIGETGVIEADFAENTLRIFTDKWEDIKIDEGHNINSVYLDELNNFLNSIKGKQAELISIDHGKHVLQVVEAAKLSSKLGRTVKTSEIYDKKRKPEIQEGKTIAIICARGGSKGVPSKNIRLLAGKPLIAYSIEQAKKSRLLDRIIVSTDSKEIADIAKQYGAEVPFMRPADLSGDKIGKIPALQHAVKWLEDNENEKVSIVVDIDPTSPLKTVEDIDACITKLKETEVDAVETVKLAGHNPYFNMLEPDEDGYLVYSKKTEHEITCRQDAPLVYEESSGIVASWRSTVIKGSYYDGRLLGVELPPERAVMIDTLMDFKLIEFLINKGS